MRLFKRKDSNRNRMGIRSDQLAERIAGGILCWQRRIADYLNFRFGHFLGLGALFGLILLAGLISAYCGYLVIRALN